MANNTIYENMMELGDRFAKQAAEAGSVKDAAKPFGLAERAYKLALAAKRSITKQTPADQLDPTLIFISLLGEREIRSAIWHNYQVFCDDYSVDPLTKGELYAQLTLLGFTVRKTNGCFFVFEPKTRPRILKAYSEKLGAFVEQRQSLLVHDSFEEID